MVWSVGLRHGNATLDGVHELKYSRGIMEVDLYGSLAETMRVNGSTAVTLHDNTHFTKQLPPMLDIRHIGSLFSHRKKFQHHCQRLRARPVQLFYERVKGLINHLSSDVVEFN